VAHGFIRTTIVIAMLIDSRRLNWTEAISRA
jgi:hypothetical protein